VLVTDVDCPIKSFDQLDRDRTDGENGFTTRDINRCQTAAGGWRSAPAARYSLRQSQEQRMVVVK